MLKRNYRTNILTVILLLSYSFVKSQNNKSWQSIASPIYSDLKKIQFTSKDTAFISSKQLLVLKGNHCEKFPQQPPCDISKMYAVNSNCIFVSNETSYQNSELYKWNGVSWKCMYNPMANNISDMFFTDSKNGVLVSYGEIAQMIDGKWRHITPPTNRGLNRVILIKNNMIIIQVVGKGIFRYQEGKWTFIKQSESVDYISYNENKIYAIGNDFLGVVESNSIHKLSQNKIWKTISSVSKNSDGVIVGVGEQGSIVTLINGVLSHDESRTKQNLHHIINHNTRLWCVGNEGTILKYSNDRINHESEKWKGFETITFNQQAKMIDDEYGVVAADFNNDGWTDVFTCGLYEQEHLYINKKDFSFENQTKVFRLGVDKNSKSKELNLGACAGDIDKDGYIDLYLGVLNGKNKIYKNIKGKYFIDYSYNTGGIGEASDRTNACIMGDVDNDGDLDIFIANEESTNRLYLNNGVGIFTEITKSSGLKTVEGGNAATFGDIDQDGDIDLYVTNWSSQNILYQNQFDKTGKVEFINITQKSNSGGEEYSKSNACIFSDIDNDGDLDLFVTNRKASNRIYTNDGKGVFEDKTEILLGLDSDSSYGAVIADFDGDSYKDIYVSNVGANVFYKNGKWGFKKKTTKFGASIKGYSTGSALSDFDNDGDLDVYIANYLGASSALLRNKKKDDNHIILQVSGVQNNRDAIGTKIYVYSKESKLLYFDEIRGGSGYVSVNDFKKVIPIQKNDSVYVKIEYPNGFVKSSSPVLKGSVLKISDSDGFHKKQMEAKQFIKKCFYDPHYLFELIKWFFVILLITISGFILQKKHKWKLAYTVLAGLFLILFYYLQFNYFIYQSFLYATLIPLVSIITSVLLIYYYFERQYVKRISKIEQNKIKVKLSRDLHDDLATTVSSIGFYLSLMKFDLKEKNPKISGFIQKSESLLQEATDAITDLIWSINPKPETIKSLLMRIQKNYQQLFIEKGISFEIFKEKAQMNSILEDTAKQNIFLIIKETLNNILKYAEATEVKVEIEKWDKQTRLTIKDNGKGFDYSISKDKGNGLLNMQKRAEEIHATIKLTSETGKGTSIEIVF